MYYFISAPTSDQDRRVFGPFDAAYKTSPADEISNKYPGIRKLLCVELIGSVEITKTLRYEPLP